MKKTKILTLTIFFTSILLSVLLLGCNDTIDPKTYDSYTITYNLDGGINDDGNPETYTIKTPTITLQAPTKPGFVFDGWFSNAAFEGTAVTTIAQGSMGDKALYARWTEYAVGDRGPAGGWIIYVSDEFYIENGWRYLEVAPADLWVAGSGSDRRVSIDTDDVPERADYSHIFGYHRPSGSNTIVTGGTDVGVGRWNTQDLVDAMGDEAYSSESGNDKTGDYAAKLCDELVVEKDGVVYDNWFLPSKDELNLMYNELALLSAPGFTDSGYWCSYECAVYAAWSRSFDFPSNFMQAYKDVDARVRPIRAFL
ncbi:InlB B-repeat-containing protein [Sphaerochaeta globosa]|uniref:Cell wall/surface repeat protein n=1 Tax=Sphaerochaeta globosa (strain ATCC BAA-1886 / DSM 22777 / Buddy) TaxID=158189 RepID=F0RZA5_SPHGB|nr:InlB B-repeat-containing protein [Sphaerochaeta globosa]ADY13386.1 cell wall/surface repeat protein [Sphaerochaeta globosa str. Buddy]